MKWSVWKAVITTVVSGIFAPAFSQNYYLVIGAFATKNDDIREFTSYLPGNAMDTAYTLYSNENMMHFFVMKTSSSEVALAKSMVLRKGIEGNSEAMQAHMPESSGPAYTGIASAALAEDAVATGSSRSSEGSSPVSTGVPSTPVGKNFKFTIIRDDGQSIPGEVHQLDWERGRELASFRTESYVNVPATAQNTPVPVVCGVFGYKEVEKYINYSNPGETDGAYLDESGAWVIPYKLERLTKGDVSVMYNVGFHKDAVAMYPTSTVDLEELVRLMTTNPNYVVRVHAHCNGRGSRMIRVASNPDDFFDPSNMVEVKASARDLTERRAEAIRTYLKMRSIDESRVKIFGWGGTEMLVNQNDPNARINDRIEIEILKD